MWLASTWVLKQQRLGNCIKEHISSYCLIMLRYLRRRPSQQLNDRSKSPVIRPEDIQTCGSNDAMIFKWTDDQFEWSDLTKADSIESLPSFCTASYSNDLVTSRITNEQRNYYTYLRYLNGNIISEPCAIILRPQPTGVWGYTRSLMEMPLPAGTAHTSGDNLLALQQEPTDFGGLPSRMGKCYNTKLTIIIVNIYKDSSHVLNRHYFSKRNIFICCGTKTACTFSSFIPLSIRILIKRAFKPVSFTPPLVVQ